MNKHQVKDHHIILLSIAVFVIFMSVGVPYIFQSEGRVILDTEILPDIQIKELDISEEQNLLTVTLHNSGPKTRFPFIITFYEREVGTTDWDIIQNLRTRIELRKEETKEYSAAWDPSKGGDMEIKVWADSGERIREEDEENNILIQRVISSNVNPELFITTLAVSSPKVDQRTLLSANIYNSGASINRAFVVKFYATSDKTGETKYIDSVTIDGLNNRASAPAKIYWVPKEAGGYVISTLVDTEKQVPEENEKNNLHEIKVTVSK